MIIIIFSYLFVFPKCFAMNGFYLHNHNIISNYAMQKFPDYHSLHYDRFLWLLAIPSRGWATIHQTITYH